MCRHPDGRGHQGVAVWDVRACGAADMARPDWQEMGKRNAHHSFCDRMMMRLRLSRIYCTIVYATATGILGGKESRRDFHRYRCNVGPSHDRSRVLPHMRAQSSCRLCCWLHARTITYQQVPVVLVGNCRVEAMNLKLPALPRVDSFIASPACTPRCCL